MSDRETRLAEALRRIASRRSGSFPEGGADRLTYFHDAYHEIIHEARAALAGPAPVVPPPFHFCERRGVDKPWRKEMCALCNFYSEAPVVPPPATTARICADCETESRTGTGVHGTAGEKCWCPCHKRGDGIAVPMPGYFTAGLAEPPTPSPASPTATEKLEALMKAGAKLEATIKGEVPERCPTCTSPKPFLHPAIQCDGEVQPCRDPRHVHPFNVGHSCHSECVNVGGSPASPSVAERTLIAAIGAVVRAHSECVDTCLVHEAGCLIEDEVLDLIRAYVSSLREKLGTLNRYAHRFQERYIARLKAERQRADKAEAELGVAVESHEKAEARHNKAHHQKAMVIREALMWTKPEHDIRNWRDLATEALRGAVPVQEDADLEGEAREIALGLLKLNWINMSRGLGGAFLAFHLRMDRQEHALTEHFAPILSDFARRVREPLEAALEEVHGEWAKEALAHERALATEKALLETAYKLRAEAERKLAEVTQDHADCTAAKAKHAWEVMKAARRDTWEKAEAIAKEHATKWAAWGWAWRAVHGLTVALRAARASEESNTNPPSQSTPTTKEPR